MPLWVNAANAVLVTSDYEGFGLACVESLACDVAVLSTPVGIAPLALRGVEGCLCADYAPGVWAKAARVLLSEPDPRVHGAARARAFSAGRMAERVIEAYAATLGNYSRR
jgi:teichuronic acid biosynthesis glycosyltransferase TuaC